MQLCATREGASDEKEKERDGIVRWNVREGWKKNERGDATRGRVGECSARESHLTGGREKGYIRRVPLLRGGLGVGAAHRTHEEGNSHAVHLLPLAPLHPIHLHHFSAHSSSRPPFSPSPPPPPPPMVSTTRFCGNPSGTFSYRCPATCRIRRFPNERPIEITRPVVFGLRAYRMVQHPPKAPVEHS